MLDDPMATAKGASTRNAILDRTADLASIDGLEGLTIGRLATELGLSKSGLFAHFGSKEELQLATVEHAAKRFYETIIEPAQAEPPGAPRLRAYWHNYLDYLQGQVFAGGCFWAAAGAEFDDRPGPVRDAIRAGLSAWLAELKRQAAYGEAADPAALAYEIYSCGLGANAYARLLDNSDGFGHARTAIDTRISELAG